MRSSELHTEQLAVSLKYGSPDCHTPNTSPRLSTIPVDRTVHRVLARTLPRAIHGNVTHPSISAVLLVCARWLGCYALNQGEILRLHLPLTSSTFFWQHDRHKRTRSVDTPNRTVTCPSPHDVFCCVQLGELFWSAAIFDS